MELVSGGYLLGRPCVRTDWHTAHLVPERTLSGSSCLTDRFPEHGVFGDYTPRNEVIDAALRDTASCPTVPLAVWARFWRLLIDDRMVYDEIFLSTDAAREVLPCLGAEAADYVLFGLSTTREHARAMVKGTLEADGHNYRHTAALAREQLPEEGEVLGWEPLGMEFSDFHSWFCNGIEREVEPWGIKPNALGFIDNFEDAKRVAAYCHEEQPEPGYWAPWRITRYQP
jgi:hypothetical protein